MDGQPEIDPEVRELLAERARLRRELDDMRVEIAWLRLLDPQDGGTDHVQPG